ncbi:MAG TPA: GNAT family N-acetyltransferase [Polyangia bacterium]
MVRFARPTPALARAQASWIAGIEPWRGLGYAPGALGRYLARKARSRAVWIARAIPRGAPLAIAVIDDGVLLGSFVALLAVRPEAGGQGLGRALVDHLAARTFASRQWLYVSCDGKNLAALRFYRRLGFSRVGRLPDLVRPGRVEILLRLRKPAPPKGKIAPAKIAAPARRVGYHQGAS